MPSYRKSAQVDMTHGSVLGRAALFALPICAGNILQLLYSTVDTLVIGNFCDTTALASVATSSQPLEILLCVFVGIGSGISILVSQAVGRADHDQLQKLVRTSVWLLFAASLPLTVIGFLLGPWMLRLMQVPADAMPGAVLYLRITMLGILGNMGYNFNAGLLRGLGNSSSSLQLLFISCAANIVLDLVLPGALGLGIGGVAAATAIALFLSWICSIFYIRRHCTELALPVLPRGFDAGTLRQIVRIGLPLGLNSALYSIGHVFLQVLYNLQGSVFVAGCSVAGKVGGLANITVTSLSQATSVFAGQNLGAQDYRRLRKGGWMIPAASGLLSLAGGLLLAVYAMLSHAGAQTGAVYPGLATGAEVLTALAQQLFGRAGLVLIAAIFVIACFNTCVGLISGVSEYFHQLWPKVPYTGWAAFFALTSMLLSNIGLASILELSVPILNAIYPAAIVLIFL